MIDRFEVGRAALQRGNLAADLLRIDFLEQCAERLFQDGVRALLELTNPAHLHHSFGLLSLFVSVLRSLFVSVLRSLFVSVLLSLLFSPFDSAEPAGLLA